MDTTERQIFSHDTLAQPLPRVSLWTMMQLGLFQMGLGMMSVLLFGLLNRVLIKELGVPGTIASIVLAVTLFVAPARIWFGQLSDTKPIFGLHRTWYVRLGALSFATIAFLAVQPLWKVGALLNKTSGSNNLLQATEWIVLSTVLFGLYGIAISASSTPFATLLVDITEEEDRSKIVAVDWAMLLMGTIAGAITIGVMLKKLGNNPSIESLETSVNQLFLVVPWLAVAMAFISTWGIEKKYSRFLRSNQERQAIVQSSLQETTIKVHETKEVVGLSRAWALLTASQQTQYFFTFLITMTLGLFLQDAILEPFGGDIFNLPAGETALLNVPYGIGTVIGILISGFFISPLIGKKKTTQVGCQAVALSLGAIILAGFTGNAAVLKLCLLLFGLASGTTTTGAITLMLDLTAAETAGTFIGTWGLAQALSRGTAAILGGSILDIGTKIFGMSPQGERPLWAYAMVLAVQAGFILGAIGLLGRVNVQEFKTDARATINAVIANDG
ncbi:MAG: BCD family MFS transporter [Cyanobacteria bacterium]|nr:BCD family MFS transporter [Cyanobacteriota bacterium]